MRVTFDDISGRAVIDATGRVIGEVDGLVLDTSAWHVDAVRVKLAKESAEELRVTHGAFRAARVEVPTGFVKDVTDTLVLRGPASALRTGAHLEGVAGSRPPAPESEARPET